MLQFLRIPWRNGEVEFVVFDEDDHFPSQITTTARWSGSFEVTYIADAELKKEGDARTMKLRYESNNQTDQTVMDEPIGEVRYGVSTIKWKIGDADGKAQWKDDLDRSFNGTVTVAVLSGQKLLISERATKSVLVKQRPQQRVFRDALFILDEKCVLTGETCREALQAAHLVPVAKEGSEQIENGILLRADLHLLFDAGLIWFEVSDNHAAVQCSSRLTERYVIDLKEKHIPLETFRRVKAALLARAILPGGRGENKDP